MYQVEIYGKERGFLKLQVADEKDVIGYLAIALRNGMTFSVEPIVTEGETDAK